MGALHQTATRAPAHPTGWTSSEELCVTAACLEKAQCATFPHTAQKSELNWRNLC